MLLAAIRLDDLDLMDIALALELEPKLETTGFAFATCDDRFEFIIFGVTAHCPDVSQHGFNRFTYTS